jgi:signal transduction histidine kinase
LLAVGATLSRLDLHSDNTTPVRDLIDELRGQLRDAREELRDLARGLHPALLTESGLHAAVTATAERLPLQVEVDIPALRWAPDIELSAYFVICEALTNCVTHADCSQASVAIKQHNNYLHMQIIDDGCGGARFCEGGGLLGLRDRVQALGGELSVRSPLGSGTTIKVALPCG